MTRAQFPQILRELKSSPLERHLPHELQKHLYISFVLVVVSNMFGSNNQYLKRSKE